MNRLASIALLACAFVGLIVSHANAQGGNFRSYVSSTRGVDTNACDTPLSPCKSLSQAYASTLPSGIITVMDGVSGGTINIAKSITIDGTGATSTYTPGSAAFIVAGSGIRVVLRGFNLDGAGMESGSPGCHGVRVDNGASVILENITIGNMVGCGNGAGVLVQSNSATKLSLINVSIENSTRGIHVTGSANVQMSVSNMTISNSTGDGILVTPSGGTTRLVIQNSKIVNSGGTGLLVAPTGSAKVNTTVIGSSMDGNVIGIRSFPGASAISNLTISDTSASNNAGGIHASSKSVVSIIRGAIGGNSSYGVGAVSPAAVRIGSSVVSGNTLGFSGPISSYGNNQLHGNTNPGSSSPIPPGSAPGTGQEQQVPRHRCRRGKVGSQRALSQGRC